VLHPVAQFDMSDIHKVILVGNYGVGKTSITKRLVTNTFSEEPGPENVDQYDAAVAIGSTQVKLRIGDTAGGEKFRTLTSGYFRNAEGVMVVYDVGNQESFDDLNNLFQEAEYYAPASVKLLIANKSDLSTRIVSTDAGKSYADSKGVPFFEVSAKTGSGVQQLWADMSKKVANIKDDPVPPKPAPGPSPPEPNSNTGKKKRDKSENGGCVLL